jgi:hypothetical protein
MIQMAECDISLSLSPSGDDVGLCWLESNFDTLLKGHFSKVVNVCDNVSSAIRIL